MAKQQTVAKSYDDAFEAYNDIVKNRKENTGFASLGSAAASSFRGYDTGWGKSDYDKGLSWNANINENDVKGSINEYRSQQQGLLPTTAAGFGRVVSKVARELLKTTGAIVGTGMAIGGAVEDTFTQEDNHDFLKTAFDNDFIRATDKAFDNINKEALPVYVSDAVTNGNFWDKITNSEFWATEGADGAGYLIAAMAPGAALKAMGVGESLFGGLTKMTSLKYGKSLEVARRALTQAGMTTSKLDNLIITGANTYFEAGAEAKGVGDDIEQRKPEFMSKRINEIKNELLKSYNPNEPEFIQAPMQIIRNPDGSQGMHSEGLIPNPNYKDIDSIALKQAEVEFNAQKGYAMRNTFLTNLAILAGPNYIQTKLIYGKNGAVNLLKKVSDKSVKRTFGKAGQRMGESFLSEGSEEVAQTSTEHRQSNKALRGELHGGLDAYKDISPNEFSKDFIKTLGTTEGQVAGFLGGFLGSPISIVQGYRQDGKDRIKSDELRGKIHTAGISLNDINLPVYKTNTEKNPETGEDIEVFERDDKGNKIPILENVIKIKNALNLHETLSKTYDDAVENGDVETVNRLRKEGEHHLIMNFIGEDEMTIDALKEHLKVTMPTDTENKQDNNNNNKRQNELIEKAKYLQKELVSFGDMSTSIIKLENENATPEQIKGFMKKLSNEFINETSRLYDQRAKLKTLKAEKSHLESQTSVLEIDNPLYQEGLSNVLDKKVIVRQNPRLDLKNSEIQKVEKEIKDSESFLNFGVWNSDIVNGAFNQELKDFEKTKERVSAETVDKITNQLQNIDDATTNEELDNIKSDNEEVNKKIAEKRQVLEELRKQREAEAAKTAIDNKNDQDNLTKDLDNESENIANNYNVGDTINEGIHQGKKVESIDGNEIKVSIIEDDGQGGFVKSIETLPLPQQTGTTSSTQSPEPKPLVDPETKAANSGDLQMPHTNTDNKSFVDYMMTPINKIGNAVNFLLNLKSLRGNSKQAVDVYNNVLKSKPTSQEDILKTKELLFKWLPITAGFNNDPSITSWTEYPGDRNNFSYTDAEGSPKFNFRRAIVDLIVDNGFSLEQINSTVSGQMAGSFNNIKGAVNNVMDLYHIKVELKGDTKKMVMYHVNDENELVHVTDNEESKYDVELINKIKDNNRGKILLSIRNLAGNMVPLFLNDKKLDSVRADILADILIFVNEKIAENQQSNIHNLTLSSIKDQLDETLYNNLILKLADEIKLLGGENKVTLNQLVNILVYIKTNKQGVGENLNIVRVLPDGRVETKIGNNTYVSDNIRDNKSSIVDNLSKLKHNIITVENSQQFITPGINFKNQEYLDYIFKNKILNTDVDTRDGHYNFKNETIRENGKVTQTGGELFVKSPVIGDVKVETTKVEDNFTKLEDKPQEVSPVEDVVSKNVGSTYIDNKGDEKIITQVNKDGSFLVKNNNNKTQNPTLGNEKDLFKNKEDAVAKRVSIEENKDVEVESRKAFDIFNNGEKVGRLGLEDNGNTYQVSSIKIDTPNKGIGTESYKQLINSLDKPLVSDIIRSDSAESVWKKLEKEGFAKFNPNTNQYTSISTNEATPPTNTPADGNIQSIKSKSELSNYYNDLYKEAVDKDNVDGYVTGEFKTIDENTGKIILAEEGTFKFTKQGIDLGGMIMPWASLNKLVNDSYNEYNKNNSQIIENFENKFTVKNEIFNIPIFLDTKAKVRGDEQQFIPLEVFNQAFNNDKLEGFPFQTADTLIRRGGYTIEELDELLPNWKILSNNIRNSKNNVVSLPPVVILEADKTGTVENQELVKTQKKVDNESTGENLSQQIIEQITDEVSILNNAKEALNKNNNTRNQNRVKASEKNIENFKKNYPNEFAKVNPKNC